MAETEAVSVATAEAIHGCYLHGEPVDEARMRSLFTKIDKRRIVDWGEKARASREGNMPEQADGFDREALRQEEDIQTAVVQWLQLVKSVLQIGDDIIKIEG